MKEQTTGTAGQPAEKPAVQTSEKPAGQTPGKPAVQQERIDTLPAERCTGCGACRNICPADAIRMAPDLEGFLSPFIEEDRCIRCGRCRAVCPALHPESSKDPRPRLCGAMAGDEIRAVSSSGGMFTLAARAVLSQGGAVCGAAFDGHMTLAHRIVEREEDLAPLRGSKYLQSDTGLVYREIRELLEKGRKVLFVGTPCQAAGLQRYLGREYGNLYTVDLLCHGVPSQQVFDRYLRETAAGYKSGASVPGAASVQFRDKKFGWSAESIRIRFQNGRVYEGSLKEGDPFEYLFLKNLGLRPSCGDCPFCEFPRQGDLSFGDFWGIERFEKSLSDRKGTSLVYLNSRKGRELWERMEPGMYQMQELAVPPRELPNRVRGRIAVSRDRERFFALWRKKGVARGVEMIRREQWDIGLVSNFYAGNFGGAMTQYALYRVLEDMGYSVLMIERPASARGAAHVIQAFQEIFLENPYPDYAIAPQYPDKESMRALNERCDTFVVGSDQLFQYALYRLLGEFVTLDWVGDDKKKIAYAASYGHEDVWGDREVHSQMAYFMQKFDAFSVRERSGVDISRRVYGVEAVQVLDPVFLCSPKHYHALADKSQAELPEHFIGGYILDPSPEKGRILSRVSEELGLPCRVFSEYNCSEEYTAPLGEVGAVQMRTEERLDAIRRCDFFVTDSFHGTCFSILFGKPFIAILNRARGEDRFRSLLGQLHLEGRLVETERDLGRPGLIGPVDYGEVEKILGPERERCRKWLEDAIRRPKVRACSDYDMTVKLIRRQEQQIRNLSRLAGELLRRQTGGLTKETELAAYLEQLKEKEGEYLIAIAVKDTPGLQLKGEISQGLRELGLQTDLKGKHSRSYAALIDRGEVVYEALGRGLEPQLWEGEVSGHRVQLVSRVYRNGNQAEIRMDGVDYAVNKRGLNIAVFEPHSGVLIDSAAFDTHVAGAPCSR